MDSQIVNLISEVIARHAQLEKPAKQRAGLEILLDLNNPFLVKLLPLSEDEIREKIEFLNEDHSDCIPTEPPVLRLEYNPEGTGTDWEVELIREPHYCYSTTKFTTVALCPLLEEVVRNDEVEYGFVVTDSS